MYGFVVGSIECILIWVDNFFEDGIWINGEWFLLFYVI